ncbi:glutamate receptor ionotropic, delta-1-like [Procambarus clarkii]|uniref:glutamate receptor ionotropic, delta-1-like n=1 Tax=Procambarus clarkii TaxID=6728 RepID=UPI0037440CC8
MLPCGTPMVNGRVGEGYIIDGYILASITKIGLNIVQGKASDSIMVKLKYEIHEEPNHFFGDYINGSFTGMMGQLQREEADLCTIMAPTPGRLAIIDFSITYPADLITVVSLKPTLLPPHLALIKPFNGVVWASVMASVVGWGVTLWALQRAWHWISSGRRVARFITSLLYGWDILLEQPPRDPNLNLSGRVLVGWWLVFCVVISTAYRSALISYLTVQGTTRPQENFEDVVRQKNWEWGTEAWMYKGASYEYFSGHTRPVVKKIVKGMQVLPAEEALHKVLAGRFTLISFYNYIAILIASRYTDDQGNTPFYISKKGFSIFAFFGWGFRKGEPFCPRFRQLMSRLTDAGIIQYWTKEVIAGRAKENRKKHHPNIYKTQANTPGVTKKCLDATDRFILALKKNYEKQQNYQWYNQECKVAKQLSARTWRNYRNNRTPESQERYQKARNEYHRVRKEAKRQYENDIAKFSFKKKPEARFCSNGSCHESASSQEAANVQPVDTAKKSRSNSRH